MSKTQLRFTTSKPSGWFERNDPLSIPQNLGVLIQSDTFYKKAYIDGCAENLAGFDIPCFLDGDMGQLDLPLEEQDILMVIPSGEYKIRAFKNDTLLASKCYLLKIFVNNDIINSIIHISIDEESPEKTPLNILYYTMLNILSDMDVDTNLDMDSIAPQERTDGIAFWMSNDDICINFEKENVRDEFVEKSLMFDYLSMYETSSNYKDGFEYRLCIDIEKLKSYIRDEKHLEFIK